MKKKILSPPQWNQKLSACVMLGLGILVIIGTKNYIPKTYIETVTPFPSVSGIQETITAEENEETKETMASQEQDNLKKEPEPDDFESSVRLNMAFLYPDGEDTGDGWNSYAGQACEILSEMDSQWISSIYTNLHVSPEQMAAQQGIGRNAVLGLYNQNDESHNPDNPDSWVISSWKKRRILFYDGDGKQITGYSNAREIVSMASVYAYRMGIKDGEAFIEYCRQLWNESHRYNVHMGSVYYCDGNCRKNNEETTDAAEESQAPPSSTDMLSSITDGAAEAPAGASDNPGVNENAKPEHSASGSTSSGPETGETAASRSSTGETVTSESAAGETAASGSSTGGTAASESVTGETVASESAAGETAASGSSTGEIVTSESATGETAASESVTGETVASGSAARETAASESVTGETAASKSVIGEIASSESVIGESSGEAEQTETANTTIIDYSDIISNYTLEDVPSNWQDIQGPERGVWEAVVAAYGGTMYHSGTKKTEEDDVVCPGHIDLDIHAVILGTDEIIHSIFDADIIGNTKQEANGWYGWTKLNQNHVHCIQEQDWAAVYGLPVETTLYLGNPLSAAEIASYMEMLPEGTTDTRRALVLKALESVGCIPYYWGGKPSCPGYDGNNFGGLTVEDEDGRNLKGLDCSGWINWLYWTVLGSSLQYEGTAGLIQCGTVIDRSELQPGDIIVRTGEDSHVYLFLTWETDGEMYVIHETGGDTNNVTVSKVNANWPYYRRLIQNE